MKRIVVCLVVLFFFSIRSFAQVNPQTGSATFSLPIFNWNDNKSRLSSIIALSYSSGNGLSVNEVATNAGQGWSMIAGGVITRVQVGLPDDQQAITGNGISDITKYPSGILYASTQAYKGCPTALTKYPIFGWQNQIYAEHNEIAEDKELDYFSFQFNGKAGMFVLDPLNIGTGIFIGDTKMKVTYEQNAGQQSPGTRTKITSFTIQDINGLKYKFAKHGLTKVLETVHVHGNLTRRLTQPDFKPDHVYHQLSMENPNFVNPYVVGSWYLTEIEDPLTLRKINFNYAIRDINSDAGEDIMYNVEKNYSIVFHKKSITQTPGIISITYPDGHIATFKYGSRRVDLNGDSVLSSVDIAYKGRNLSKHEFNTSYIMLNRYGTPVSDYQKKVARLYLRSVRKIGPDLKEDSPPYIFDYYTGSNTEGDFVPPPYFYAKDIWGFYNADNSKGYWLEEILLNKTTAATLSNNQLRGLCFLRYNSSGISLNAKSGYAQNGLLRQIIYPTGGTLTYSYVQNTGIIGGNSVNVGGVHVSSTSSTDGGHSNGCANPITTQYNYVLSGGASSLWGLEMPVNATYATSHYQPEWKYYKWSFPFGGCDWKFKFPGIVSQQQVVSITDFQNIMNFLAPVFEIMNVIATISDVLTALSPTGNPVFLIIDVIVGLVNVAVTCIGNQQRDNSNTTFYNFNLAGVSPLPSQFKRVEIVEGSGSIGKTVQEFTSSDDYSIWENTNPYFSSKQRFASWAYGLPKKTTVYNVGGNKIKETENIYSYANAKQIIKPCDDNYESGLPPCNPTGIPSAIISCNCTVVRSASQRYTDWSNSSLYNSPSSYRTTSNTDLKVDYYALYTGRVTLSTSYERIFKPTDQTKYSEVVSEFEYSSYTYDVKKTKVTQSNGDKSIKEVIYSGEYYGGMPYYRLQNNNVLSEPAIVINSVIKSGSSTSQDLHETVINLVELSNGNVKPESISEKRFDKPYTRNSVPPAYIQTQFFTYDENTNLIGLKDEGNRMITNLYGYDDKYIVASVINAGVNDSCAYTSFEDYPGWTGWSLTGTAAYNTSTSMTGVRSFSLSTSTTFSRSSLNTSKAYTLSFWSTAAITVTGGATLTKSAPIINGFTYYEYDIAQGTSSVSVSGNANIDELRLFPKTARMRSVAYDPIIGKLSESDENNRITYYEYDNLGRLKMIKDQDKNIVKMYEYNNIDPSKQNGCPQTYYNKMIKEVFSKSCGAGYISSTVTYTVAANTYSSTLSQADADAQAEHDILTNGQNYANTNGTCTLLYYNTVQSQSFATQNCQPGYVGGNVTYTVPANSYISTVSQSAANQLAIDEINANGQAYANANPSCTISYSPLWTWLDGAASYCSNGHLFVYETDINPNSSTYNSTRWTDVGLDNSCPPPSVTLYYANYTNQVQYIVATNVSTNEQYYFYATNGSSGILGDVPEGTYNIEIYDGYGYYFGNYQAGCSAYTSGYSATFYNITLSSTCNTINIYGDI